MIIWISLLLFMENETTTEVRRTSQVRRTSSPHQPHFHALAHPAAVGGADFHPA
jgi:hypothetical protein